MVLPCEYDRYFPFENIRDQQRTAIEFTLDAFLVKKKKYVILEMGTGCGKSPTGVCISRALNAYYASQSFTTPVGKEARPVVVLDELPGTWYLTTQKVLQEQYVSDFGHGAVSLRTIKSSSNYQCQLLDKASYKLSCGEVSRLKKAHKMFQLLYRGCDANCRYREEKHEFVNALDSLTNYSYFFAESQYRGDITPRTLLVLDEAHTLEEQLGKFIEITVSERFAKERLGKRMPASFKDMQHAIKWLRGYKKSLQLKINELTEMLNNISENDQKISSLTDYARQVEVFDKHLCKVNRFLKEFTQDNWVMNIQEPVGKSLRKIVFKPVDVSKFAYSHVFDFGKHVLLMSATILDKEVFCRSLGIPLEDAEFLRIPSPFPVENRPVHYMPVGKMSKAHIDKTLPMMSEAIKFILEEHKNEKGIIHCVNYRVAKCVYETVASPRLLIHDAMNRDSMVEYHCESDEPTVLVSPSMTEGVDLRGDRSRFQIMCKLPFPFLGDLVVQKRMKSDRSWYDYQTVRSIIQAMGRSIRSDDDYAVSYILDGDWQHFYTRTKHMFPNEFSLAVR